VGASNVHEKFANFHNEPPPNVATVVAPAEFDDCTADGNKVENSQNEGSDHEEPESEQVTATGDPKPIKTPEKRNDGKDDAIYKAGEEGRNEPDDGQHHNDETKLLQIPGISLTPL